MKALGWLSLLFAVFFGLVVACGQPALSPDECDRELAKITTGCTAEIELCGVPGQVCETEECRKCVENARAKCQQQKDEACQ